ncbi:MAG: hypothetical protein ABJK39_00355 [Hyphomicrobiales bacterium]
MIKLLAAAVLLAGFGSVTFDSASARGGLNQHRSQRDVLADSSYKAKKKASQKKSKEASSTNGAKRSKRKKK